MGVHGKVSDREAVPTVPRPAGLWIHHQYMDWRPGAPAGASHHLTNPAVMFGQWGPQDWCPGELTRVFYLLAMRRETLNTWAPLGSLRGSCGEVG